MDTAILQLVVKHQPIYGPCDTKRDFKVQFEVTLTYGKVELAQNDLYGLTRHSYDSLRYYFPLH